MHNVLRNSGIDLISKIPWGTHLCQLYSSQQEIYDVIVPYINTGLENNELCVWIYEQGTGYLNLIGELKRCIKNFEKYLKSNQFLMIPHSKWYLKDNSFNEKRVITQWKALLKQAMDKGFDGLRAAGDTSWLEKNYFTYFSQYEHGINNALAKAPILVLFLYDSNKVDTFEIVDIISSHTYILIKREDSLRLIKNFEVDKAKLLDTTSIDRIKELEKSLKENRRLLQETLKNDKLKTEFLGNISHELRTPLNVILASLQLFNLEKITSFNDMGDALKTIQQNCFRLLRLINNIIDITKIDSNYFDIKLENYDIVNLVESITGSVVKYAKNKGITIIFDTDTEEKIIACDPDQIERIMLNLLSNAIKFTPSGGNIWVLINCMDKIKITIKDTGRGIPSDKQKHIFDRFQQVDKPLTRENEGSGIGLSLVKALIKKHGGKITLNSELGKGSEFIISLPCKLINSSKQKTSINNQQNDNGYVQKISIELSDIYS